MNGNPGEDLYMNLHSYYLNNNIDSCHESDGVDRDKAA